MRTPRRWRQDIELGKRTTAAVLLSGIPGYFAAYLIIGAIWPDWRWSVDSGRWAGFTGRELIAYLGGAITVLTISVVVLWKANIAADERDERKRRRLKMSVKKRQAQRRAKRAAERRGNAS